MNRHERYLRPATAGMHYLWVGPLVFSILAVALAVGSREMRNKASELDAANLILKRDHEHRSPPKPGPMEVERQKHWNELRAERDFPWALVFTSVEQADRKSIELLEFRPDKRNRRVILRGEAQDRAAVTAYLQELTIQPAFTQVHMLHLQNHARNNLNTVGFEIKATIR